MRVRESETRRRMVELAVGPLDRVVTALTGCRESQLRVVDRRGCRVVVLQVARRASRRGQVVVVVDVAVEADARRVSVRIRQWKSYRGVIEGGRLPSDGRVAGLAGLREPSQDVVRIRRALKILQVTRNASRSSQVVVVVDMAVEAQAGRGGVSVGQRKSDSVVIERRRLPRNRRVTGLAGLRETSLDVIGTRRSLKILQMAGHTSCARQVEIIIDVTVDTNSRRISVRVRQRETRGRMIELRVQPRVRVVALLATCGESHRHVVGVRRALKIGRVT